MKSVIADNVKRIIRDKGLKQCVVAEWAGYHPKTFSNLLNGRKVITDLDVQKISRALNATPNQLFGILDKRTA